MDEPEESGSSLTASDEEVTQKIVLHVYDDESKEFTSLTTYHGMIRIYSSETWPSRIFWSLVVVTCLTLFMIHSGLMLFFYHSKPTFFKTTEIPLRAEQLPAVTICRVGGKKWNKYSENHLTKNKMAIADAIFNSGSFDSSELEKLTSLEETYTRTTGHKFNLKQILLETRTPCEQSIMSVYISGRRIKNHCQQAEWTLTEFGYCNVFRWEHTESAVQSFRANVVSESDELVMFQVRRPNIANTLNVDGIYVRRGRTAKLAIQPRKVWLQLKEIL
ncbi:hypothetical protein OESDEN_04363 [Oesophagostomum dentatum]|uniref:Amiloride-sensitive sodium channel n=1 Tax=Oesophagostomum dentatum TaxID=61180 RepID=A0A0B1TJX9_OESDE|nr:hypothetical protein OESDEN_04363 [Oesophagostomum dentatum]